VGGEVRGEVRKGGGGGVNSLKKEPQYRNRTRELDPGLLTSTGWAAASLCGSFSTEAPEVKSRMGPTASGEPRSTGWTTLVRLMVLWTVNGEGGGALSQPGEARQ